MTISESDLEYYLNFNNKHVRALAWIIKSPMLLSQPQGKTSELVADNWADNLSLDWLKELDRNPDALLQWLNKKQSYRLGIRFEYLLTFLFKQLESINLIENLKFNLPIYDESKQTLGELDLIYFDTHKQQRFHWENAVKFFLYQPQEYNFERWVGPNGGDWLQRKMEYLFGRQLGITNTQEAKMLLAKTFTKEQNNTPLNRRAFVKGMLFHPLQNDAPLNQEEKQYLNLLSKKGWWAYSDQFHLADPGQTGRWRVVDKLDWIIPQIHPYTDDNMLKPSEMSIKIKHHFRQSKRSLMLAHYQLDEVTQMWIEKQRGILVDKLWPSYTKI